VPQIGLARLRAAGLMGDLTPLEGESRTLLAAGHQGVAHLAHALAVGLDGNEALAVHLLDVLLTSTERGPETRAHPTLPRVAAASAAVARVAFLQRIATSDALVRAARLVPDMLARLTPQRLLWALSIGAMVSSRFVDLLDAEAARDGGHPLAAEAAEALRRFPRPYPDQTPPGHDGHLVVDNSGLGDPDSALTSREVDVLRALALGGSNAQIGESLFVSGNTVKSHLASIYRKLGVDGRREALEAGRRLDLL
jgi:DNA-binding CsgD family transcriptional regulator